MVNLSNKKIGFEVQIRGEKHVLTPEQIMGFYLKKVSNYFENAGLKSKNIVVAVPSYMANTERQAYIDACAVGGIHCPRLINESTAIALTYGFFRKADLNPTKPRIVCFVDFGHSKLTVTFASFLPNRTKIISSHSNRNIGARNIDLMLFELFADEFTKKHGIDPRENARCRLRMLDAIEKMRKLLTSNKEADLIVESLIEDIDFNKHFTRDAFEKLITPVLQQFDLCLKEALAHSGLGCDHIDFVELVGEATRITSIIESIKHVYRKKELSRTLNS